VVRMCRVVSVSLIHLTKFRPAATRPRGLGR
jgi:hypothetical protein